MPPEMGSLSFSLAGLRVGEPRHGCSHSPGQCLSHHPPVELLRRALMGTQDEHRDRQKNKFPLARKRAELTLVRPLLLSSLSITELLFLPSTRQPSVNLQMHTPVVYSAYHGMLAMSQLCTHMGQSLPGRMPGEHPISILIAAALTM